METKNKPDGTIQLIVTTENSLEAAIQLFTISIAEITSMRDRRNFSDLENQLIAFRDRVKKFKKYLGLDIKTYKEIVLAIKENLEENSFTEEAALFDKILKN